MTKQEAINLFGGKSQLIEALGCSRQMIFDWNNELTKPQSDRVIGAAFRVNVERAKNAADLHQTLESLI